MSNISTIIGIATVILLIWYATVWIKKGFKKSILLLIIALILAAATIFLKSEENETTLRVIFGVTSTLWLFLSFFYHVGEADETKKFNAKSFFKIFIVAALMFLMTFSFGLKISDTVNYSSGKKCAFCEKRTRSHGIYCSTCYDATHPD